MRLAKLILKSLAIGYGSQGIGLVMLATVVSIFGGTLPCDRKLVISLHAWALAVATYWAIYWTLLRTGEAAK